MSATVAIVAAAAATAVGAYTQSRAARKAGRAAEDAARRQAELDRQFAGMRAEFIRGTAELRASILEEQGALAAIISEYNAELFEQQAEVAIKLTQRDVEIIGHNAAIEIEQRQRVFQRAQSTGLAAVGASGVALSGSPIYALLENAAQAEYERNLIGWQATIAAQGRAIEGFLQFHTSVLSADRERYIGELEQYTKNREAEYTRAFGDFAAQAEEMSGEFAAMSSIISGQNARSYFNSQAMAIFISGLGDLARLSYNYAVA